MRSLPRRVFDEIAAEASYQYRRIARPRTISQRGVRLPLDHGSYSEPVLEMLNRGWYEGTEAEILIKVLRPDDVVLELGTGIGFLSSLCCKVITDHGDVHTFEANPELIPVAHATYQLNGVSPNLRHAAISPETGELEFFIHTEFWRSSITANEHSKRVCVPSIAVNDVLKAITPSMIICDIEGGEIGLFDHAILSCVKKMLIEVHPAITGEAAIRDLIEIFFKAGLVLDTFISARNNLYLHRQHL